MYEDKYPEANPATVAITGQILGESVRDLHLAEDKVKVKGRCPTCGHAFSFLGDVHEACTGEPFMMRVWCNHCAKADEVGYEGHPLRVRLTLTLTVEPAKR